MFNTNQTTGRRYHQNRHGLSDLQVESFGIKMFPFLPALPDSWYRFGSKLLKLFPARRTWEQARQFCQSIGGELVSINHENENEFVYHLFRHIKTDTTGDCLHAFFRNKSGIFVNKAITNKQPSSRKLDENCYLSK